jgi:hypothetical protein
MGSEINYRKDLIPEIENWGTDIAGEQYWRRKELPNFLNR